MGRMKNRHWILLLLGAAAAYFAGALTGGVRSGPGTFHIAGIAPGIFCVCDTRTGELWMWGHRPSSSEDLRYLGKPNGRQ